MASIARNQLEREDFSGLTTGRRLPPVHPGSVLLADFVKPMGITHHRVARTIGIRPRRVDSICAGERAITADIAVRLGLAFGTDPQFWMRLQAQYDIEVLQRTRGEQLAKQISVLAPRIPTRSRSRHS